MIRSCIRTAVAAAILSALSVPAFAHVTLALPEAAIGSSYKAILQVPHGCDGAATTGLRVQVPEGFIAVKPQPKPGWTLETKSGAYAKAYDSYGAQVSEGVTEVMWSGGELPDAFYDEFMLRGTIAAGLEAGSTLHFAVIQQCGDASKAWIEIPDAGGPEPELPAPGVKLINTSH